LRSNLPLPLAIDQAWQRCKRGLNLQASKPLGGTMKILYVEDNDDSVYMLKNRLALAGFTVMIATDGQQGVAIATSEQPDLILMDLSVPVLDGWEATGRIKALAATKHIPVIAITANAMAGDKEKAMAAGCDDFDTKPVDMLRLLGKIRALIPSAPAARVPQAHLVRNPSEN
jgi:two-component system cell cycle response regulator DivK